MASSSADVHWLPGHSNARETEALNRALQTALYGTTTSSSPDVYWLPAHSTARETEALNQALYCTPTSSSTSSFSASPSIPSPSPTPPPAAKIKKRKSRAKSDRQTTYITTDAANFRRLVQEATGWREGLVQNPAPMVETMTPAGFFRGWEAAVCGSVEAAVCGSVEAAVEERGRVEYDRFQSCYFPTLESWTVSL